MQCYMYQDAGQHTKYTHSCKYTHTHTCTHIHRAAESYLFQENIGYEYKITNNEFTQEKYLEQLK